MLLLPTPRLSRRVARRLGEAGVERASAMTRCAALPSRAVGFSASERLREKSIR